jgi:hypothetical protein
MPRRGGANFLHDDRSHFPCSLAFRLDLTPCFGVAFGLSIFCSTVSVGISRTRFNDMNCVIHDAVPYCFCKTIRQRENDQ